MDNTVTLIEVAVDVPCVGGNTLAASYVRQHVASELHSPAFFAIDGMLDPELTVDWEITRCL